MNINLAENLHLVLQGEGNLVGKKMLLIRVANCNVHCTDCDSKNTWNKDGVVSYSVEELSELVGLKKKEKDFDYIMFTGGSPALYKDFIYRFILLNQQYKYQIEDAGDTDWSIFKQFDNIYFSFSPKIGALQGQSVISEWKAFDNLPYNYICKVVVDRNEWGKNLKDIQSFQQKYKIPNDKIYLMPKGIHREEIIEQSQFIIEKCFEYNYQFSPRLHVLVYDNKKLV